jgi:V/A-type H+-transporting ATPase subunit K
VTAENLKALNTPIYPVEKISNHYTTNLKRRLSMAIKIISVLLIMSITLPILGYFGGKKTSKNGKAMLLINISSFFMTLLVSTVLMFSSSVFAAPETAASVAGLSSGLGYLAAALVTGLSTIGAGIAVAAAASTALGAISEDPKLMGKSLIFVALAEGIALYGLLVSFSILARI